MTDGTPALNISTREFDARMEEVRRAVDLARSPGASAVDLREHIDRIFEEQQRAMDIAERERSKAADALAAQQQRALEAALVALSASADVADQQQRERVSAVADQVTAGDLHLRQHIDQQVGQIQAALDSARRESGLVNDSSEKAISKAEAANEKRFEALNGSRGQAQDVANGMLPREVAEAQFQELRKLIASNTARIDETSGRASGVTSTVGYLLAAATLIISIVVVIANNA